MKSFLTVLNFELANYLKKKSFIVSTLIICLVAIIGLSIPTIIKSFKDDSESSTKASEKVTKTDFAILDEKNIIKDKSILQSIYPNSNWINVKSETELETIVKSKKLTGFKVNSLSSFIVFVENKSLNDKSQNQFSAFLSKVYQRETIKNLGVDESKASSIDNVYNTPMQSEFKVLGKDSSKSYFYAYILIFAIYMVTIMYGNLIAMSITTEKSSRAIEVLITSTSTNNIVFAKVIASCIASIVQTTAILTSAMLSYKFNEKTLSSIGNGILDKIFNIPSNILIVFAVFGIIGYIFYAFIFATLGALVSKTEDLGGSIGVAMMFIMAAFFISMFSLTSSNNMLVKIASFVPFTSPMCMIVRVSLGSIEFYEIIISAVILIISTILFGLGTSKIYRLATLMYGNPIKLKHAFKLLKTKN